MSKDLVSVIVPVYNVEKYLEKCLGSICSQTYTELEILVVDDGSPDDSISICKSFASRDNRVKIIRKRNGGLASARNAALDVSTGKYVICVDSDDWIEDNMVETLVNDMTVNDVDMVVCDYFIDCGEVSTYNNENPGDEIHLDKNKAMIYAMLPEKFYGFAWNKIYKRELIGDLRYNENFRKGEDSPFTCAYINKCNRVLYHKVPLYHYKSDSTSITRSNFSEWKMSVLDAYSSIVDMLIDNDYPDNIINLQKVRYANQLLSLSINIVTTDKKKYKKQLNFIKNEMKKYWKLYAGAESIDIAHKTVYFLAMHSTPLLSIACSLKK